ncbi:MULTISPECIES: glycosyltransferase [unclassified Knoellia]|uniref:glycosyltransferase n=1 Tax=Knoellia altitudinis TaxID=3404795 RepID=UPI003614C13E
MNDTSSWSGTVSIWAVLTALVLVAAMVALARHQLARLRILGGDPIVGEPGLPDTSAAPEHDLSELSIVVPARNEAASIPALLASLAPSSSSLADLLVVDDGSSDGTAELARAGGARVLTAPVPPDGWTGKSWACHLGAGATAGRLLLFLDADTVLAEGALPALLELHRQDRGLLSVQPHHRPVHAYEHLSSYFNLVSLMGSGLFARRPPTTPMAFGPCLLTTRDDYAAAGGHEGIRAEILDDAQLAAAYGRTGLPVSCVVGGAAVAMRMYPGGLRQLLEGWTKNFASGATQADRRSSVAAALWVACHAAVAGASASALVDALSAATAASWWLVAVWLGAWAATAAHLRHELRRIGSFRWWTWVLFPLPLAVFGLVFVRSLVLTHVLGTVRWRGRDVTLGRRLRSP